MINLKTFAMVATGALAVIGGTVQAQQPAPVRVDAIRFEQVQQRRMVTGNVRAVTRSQIAAIEPGRVLELPVQEGQKVREGEKLARLDGRRLEIQLSQLHADLEVQRALLAERVASVELRLNDLELLESLDQRGATNPKELSDAQLELRIAEARREQAKREIAVKQANAQLIEQRILDMTITAPFDGIIISRLTERGQWVSEGDPILGMISTGEFDVWLDVPQRFTRAVSRADVDITVYVDAVEQAYEGQGTRIVNDVDASARTFSFVVRISENGIIKNEHSIADGEDDDSPRLAPGMSVTAWIPTGGIEQQLTVHKDAILRNESGPYVYVLRPGSDEGDEMAAPVQIDVLFSLAERVVVRGGMLREGDRVVVEGNERLRPMAPVRAVQAN